MEKLKTLYITDCVWYYVSGYCLQMFTVCVFRVSQDIPILKFSYERRIEAKLRMNIVVY